MREQVGGERHRGGAGRGGGGEPERSPGRAPQREPRDRGGGGGERGGLGREREHEAERREREPAAARARRRVRVGIRGERGGEAERLQRDREEVAAHRRQRVLPGEARQRERRERRRGGAGQPHAPRQEEAAQHEQRAGGERERVAGGEQRRAQAQQPGVQREREREEAGAAVAQLGRGERAVERAVREVVGERHPGAGHVVERVPALPGGGQACDRQRGEQEGGQDDGEGARPHARGPGQRRLPGRPRGRVQTRSSPGGHALSGGAAGARTPRRDRNRPTQPAGSQPNAHETPR
ncbi:hypothetical protein PSR1_03353 [Anaeromyxobacter sp. PSR-1]|nr:hypothetical protein PSR1_03353 [Anaeromyxobacter sp. PSR-1]